MKNLFNNSKSWIFQKIALNSNIFNIFSTWMINFILLFLTGKSSSAYCWAFLLEAIKISTIFFIWSPFNYINFPPNLMLLGVIIPPLYACCILASRTFTSSLYLSMVSFRFLRRVWSIRILCTFFFLMYKVFQIILISQISKKFQFVSEFM